MGRYSAMVILLGAAICVLSACRADDAGTSDTSGGVFGDTTETFYNCQTATQIEGSKSVFEVAKINNTLREISLNIVTSKQTQKLRKKADQVWENETFALRLGLKQDGSKSIQVHYKSLNSTASFENGYCKMFCGENAQRVGNSCLAAGRAAEDPIGNAVIETIGTLGVGLVKNAFVSIARAALAKGASVNANAFVAAGRVDQFATRLELEKIAESVNPLKDPINAHLSPALRAAGGNTFENCGNCAIATARALDGNPAVALPGNEILRPELYDVADHIFKSPWLESTNLLFFIKTLMKYNEGGQWIGFVSGPNGGHLFNFVVQKGKVWVIDGQLGRVYDVKTYLNLLGDLAKGAKFFYLKTGG